VGPPKLPPAARGVPPRVHPAVFEAAHRAAQRHRLGCHRGFPCRHHLPVPGEQTGAQNSHSRERTDGRRHQVQASGATGSSASPDLTLRPQEEISASPDPWTRPRPRSREESRPRPTPASATREVSASTDPGLGLTVLIGDTSFPYS
jgi:hypothetical protein